MVNVVSKETGEVLLKFDDYAHRWYDEGKKLVKMEIRKIGYKFVGVKHNRYGVTVLAEEDK